MTLQSTKFWDFSSQLYGKDGVAEICLDLQDKLEVDVNLLLFCYWVAHFKNIPSESEWTRIFEFSKSWQKEIVQPLRNARKSITEQLKNQPSNPDYAELKEQLKSNELDAERIQQETIQSMLGIMAADSQPFSTEDAMLNLSYYFSKLAITQTKELKKNLIAIARVAATS